jgi:predicted DNA-binding transcriptional regulator YafY
VAEDYGIDPEWGYIRLQLIDLMYITPILLTEGSKMEVLVPERLRNLMAQKVKELALLYYPELDFETGQEAHKEQNII